MSNLDQAIDRLNRVIVPDSEPEYWPWAEVREAWAVVKAEVGSRSKGVSYLDLSPVLLYDLLRLVDEYGLAGVRNALDVLPIEAVT